jgi:hypothetical protein
MSYVFCETSGFNCGAGVFALLRCYMAACTGTCLLMFWDSLSIPFSRVKQSKRNAGNRWTGGYIGDNMHSDWFSGKVSEA